MQLMTKMQCLQIKKHLQKGILQQSTQLYIILFLVKLTLCMDGVGRGSLEHFHGVLLDNVTLYLECQARWKLFLNMNLNVALWMILVASKHYKNGNLTKFQFLTHLICAMLLSILVVKIVYALTHVHVRRIGVHFKQFYYASIPLGWYYIPYER